MKASSLQSAAYTRWRLSPGQEALWFIARLVPTSGVYNIGVAYQIEGPLDLSRLSGALNQIANRHPILTSLIHDRAEGVWQVVVDDAPEIPLSVQTIEDWPANPCSQVSVFVSKPFDLIHELPIRAAIFRMNAERHVFVLCVHHLVADAWSLDLIAQELSAAYAGMALTDSNTLAQYAEFVASRSEPAALEHSQRARQYWLARLQGAPHILELPAQYPRSAVRDFSGATYVSPLPAPMVERLKQFCRARRHTLPSVLLAAYAALLHRYTGRSDFLAGMPMAARITEETERVIGLFANVVPLRFRADPARPFAVLLCDTWSATLEAMDRQDYPFSFIVHDLKVARDWSREPLVQNIFNYVAIPKHSLRLPGAQVKRLDLDTVHSKYDFAFEILDDGVTLQCMIIYDSKLFDEHFVRQIYHHYLALLDSALVDPQVPLRELSLLSAAERQQLLVEWNNPTAPYSDNKCIHELFEAQAARTPDKIAVVFDRQALSYAELNSRANQLAHHLRERGLCPDRLAAIGAERSIETLVGLLAILKAGGAYVPLDLEYPPERLAHILRNTVATVLRSPLPLRNAHPTYHGAIVDLETEAAQIAEKPRHNPASAVHPLNLACCIHTSGSTGTPKAVGIQHSGVSGLVREANYACLNEREVFLHAAPLAFDASTFEIWGSLANGARLVILRSGKTSLDELATVIEAERVSTLFLTAALFDHFCTSHLAALKGVRQLVTGGDVLSPVAIERALGGLPQCRLINAYGPTESTTLATCYSFPHDFSARSSAPIGYPIQNSAVYILDEARNPVPIGVAGEIHIAGAGLARGYLQQPAMTAEKFIPDPFGQPGGRMYKSGDLGFHQADGKIKFLGRIDYQVKIRGFRIELGEIETALSRCPGVREAVVAAREDGSGSKRLVAYVVAYGTAPTIVALRARLQETLPEYMLPSVWMFLGALPINANGKVDRKALPNPHTEWVEHSGIEYAAPRTAIEELLANIWAEVLKVDRVGIHDNFFTLGGDSLLANRVVVRIDEALRVQLSLRDFFSAPSLAHLAEKTLTAVQGGPQPAIERADRALAPPASYAQHRLWFVEQYQPGTALYNIAGAWRIHGALNGRVLKRALDEIVRRHETLRTTFRSEGGEPVQVISEHQDLNLTVVDLSQEADGDARAQRLFNAEAERPFDLVQGPLFRAGLIKLDDTEHVFFLTLHHIIADGWSLGLLLRELCVLYRACSLGQPSPLRALPHQYADFAVSQRSWLQGDLILKQLDYWRRTLEGARERLTLRTDRPRPAVLPTQGATVNLNLDAAFTETLRKFNQRSSVTLFMSLCTALNVLLYSYCRQDDICIGYPIANRSRLEFEGLLGFFANTLVLRTRVSADRTFEDVLRQIRESVLNGDAHQDLPFQKLVEALHPRRSRQFSPLFQVMLALNGAWQGTLDLPGLTVQPLETPRTIAKFDLTLSMVERRDELRGVWEYNTALFDKATIERMATHFQRLLAAAIAEPQATIKDLAERCDIPGWRRPNLRRSQEARTS